MNSFKAKTLIKRLLLSAGCVCVFGAHNVHAEVLSDAVYSAMYEHPGAMAAMAAQNATSEDKRDARSGYFPTLSLGATAGRTYGDNATTRGLNVTRGAGYSGLGEGTLTARQMIFDGSQTRSQLESAKARTSAANMDVLDARENLAYRAVQAYLNVLRTRQSLDVLSAHAQKIDDYLGRIKIGVDEGVSDESEYQQARDVQAMFEGFVADYAGQAVSADADYREIVGRAPEEMLEFPIFDLQKIPNMTDDAINTAWAVHPGLQSAALSAKSVEHEIKSEKSSLLPKVNGEVSYLKSDKEDILGGEVTDARAVLRMNWDIETGGGQLARVDRKSYEHQESLARMHETRRQVERNIRQAYAELETAQAKLETQDTRMDLNEKLFETYQVQFEGARISLLQLMQTDNQVLNTQLETLNAAFRVMNAQYGVLASMGVLQNIFDQGDALIAMNDMNDGGQ